MSTLTPREIFEIITQDGDRVSTFGEGALAVASLRDSKNALARRSGAVAEKHFRGLLASFKDDCGPLAQAAFELEVFEELDERGYKSVLIGYNDMTVSRLIDIWKESVEEIWGQYQAAENIDYDRKSALRQTGAPQFNANFDFAGKREFPAGILTASVQKGRGDKRDVRDLLIDAAGHIFMQKLEALSKDDAPLDESPALEA